MHEKPGIFWAVVIGMGAPLSFVVIPPLRRWAGDENPPLVPLTYPGKYISLSRCGKRKEEGRESTYVLGRPADIQWMGVDPLFV
jgi:hypothetical protein